MQIAILAFLSACLLAANEVTQGGVYGLLTTYLYWIFRIIIEASFFVATLYSIERFVGESQKTLVIYALSILLSLIPFTLAITSLDLIVGLPEMGLNDNQAVLVNHYQAFLFELIYLFDNHLALCTLLLLPRVFSSLNLKMEQDLEKDLNDKEPKPLFFETISPSLDGNIFRIEAQEHYIRIITNKEKRMVLYRFSDAVREMPTSIGMQVHRSHWVANSAIKELVKEGQQKTQLKLIDNEIIPVSRSFQEQVEERYSQLKATT